MVLLTGIYIFCLVAGLLWAVIAAFLGDILGGHDVDVGGHDFDVGGHDVDIGGHDVDIGGHDVDVGGHDVDAAGHDVHGEVFSAADHSSGMHMSPFSPMIIAVFMATFGGIGLIVNYFHPALAGLTALPAAVAGVGVSGVVMVGFNKLSTKVEGSSQAFLSHLIGMTAEVTTPIPQGKLGEISYVARGSRYIGPARAANGGRLDRSTQVLITDIQGGTFVVEPLLRPQPDQGKV
jgi:membrane protein implicated in regulation of membrane protease activity